MLEVGAVVSESPSCNLVMVIVLSGRKKRRSSKVGEENIVLDRRDRLRIVVLRFKPIW